MTWSRLWLLLLGLAALIATATVVMMPRAMQRRLDELLAIRVDAAERSATNVLMLQARKWIDATGQVAADAPLIEALATATRGGGDNQLLHRTVQERLRHFNRDWKADLLLAADAKGRAVARIGLDESGWGDDVSGYAIVAEALRGYRLDDLWDVDGRLYRVTAAPVADRERYVGCLLVGHELADALARRIRDVTSTETALLVGERVVARSSSSAALDALPGLAKEQAKALAEGGRSAVLPLAVERQGFRAVLSRLPGSAAARGATLALFVERPAVPSLLGALRETWSSIDPATFTPGSLAPTRLLEVVPHDLAAALGGLLLVILLGLLSLSLEHGRRLRRLLRETQALARGDLPRLAEHTQAGAFARIARAINATVERLAAEGVDRPRRTSQSGDLAIAAAEAPPRSGGLALSDHSLAPSPPEPSPAAAVMSPPIPLPPAVALASPAASARELTLEPAHSSLGPPLVALPLAALTAAPPQLAPPSADAGYEPVFREFLAAKQRCGEDTTALTLDKFVTRLRQNREQLIQQYGCRDVKFHVYIKDGRAALRASPVSG